MERHPVPVDPSEPFDVTCVGVISEDTIAEVDRTAGPDERVLAREIVRAGGGPAATAAVAAARSGLRVAVVGCVGDDTVGRGLLADLRSEGVDTEGVELVGDARTSQSVIVVDRGSSTRTIYNIEGPRIPPALSSAATERVTASSWVHCDQFGWPAVRALRSVPGGSRISVDAGNDIADLRLDGLALYAPTEAKLRERYGTASAPELLARAIDDGAELVVATRGSEGAVGMRAGGDAVSVPTRRAGEIRSTLGAGDVFHGALIAALTRFDPAESEGLRLCLEYASIAATLSCRAVDGRSAIPDAAEIFAVMRQDRPASDGSDDRGPENTENRNRENEVAHGAR